MLRILISYEIDKAQQWWQNCLQIEYQLRRKVHCLLTTTLLLLRSPHVTSLSLWLWRDGEMNDDGSNHISLKYETREQPVFVCKKPQKSPFHTPDYLKTKFKDFKNCRAYLGSRNISYSHLVHYDILMNKTTSPICAYFFFFWLFLKMQGEKQQGAFMYESLNCLQSAAYIYNDKVG